MPLGKVDVWMGDGERRRCEKRAGEARPGARPRRVAHFWVTGRR